MQIIIKGKQTHVTPKLREYIEQKLQRLSRLLHDDTRIEVTVAEEQTRSAKDHYTVRVVLSGESQPVHSEVSAPNAATALDAVIDKLSTQLSRQKDRAVRKRTHARESARKFSLARTGALAALDATEEEEASPFDDVMEEEHNEQIWAKVMEIRSLPAEPMSDREVITHMEESGAAFYPFFNPETNSVNVMYKLDSGGYGLLVPTQE